MKTFLGCLALGLFLKGCSHENPAETTCYVRAGEVAMSQDTTCAREVVKMGTTPQVTVRQISQDGRLKLVEMNITDHFYKASCESDFLDLKKDQFFEVTLHAVDSQKGSICARMNEEVVVVNSDDMTTCPRCTEASPDKKISVWSLVFSSSGTLSPCPYHFSCSNRSNRSNLMLA